MNFKKEMDSELKKGKFRRKKIKRVTSNYLSHICLTGRPDAQHAHFDALIANDFDCFLSFHRINASANAQTDYFNYYKLLAAQQLNGATSRHLDHFINTEFNQFDISLDPASFYRLYIQSLLTTTTKKSSRRRSKPTAIPEIKILTFEEADEKCLVDNRLRRLSFSDNESEKVLEIRLGALTWPNRN